MRREGILSTKEDLVVRKLEIKEISGPYGKKRDMDLATDLAAIQELRAKPFAQTEREILVNAKRLEVATEPKLEIESAVAHGHAKLEQRTPDVATKPEMKSNSSATYTRIDARSFRENKRANAADDELTEVPCCICC